MREGCQFVGVTKYIMKHLFYSCNHVHGKKAVLHAMSSLVSVSVSYSAQVTDINHSSPDGHHTSGAAMNQHTLETASAFNYVLHSKHELKALHFESHIGLTYLS